MSNVITIIPLLIGLIGCHFLSKSQLLGLICLFAVAGLVTELLTINAVPSVLLLVGLCACFHMATRPMLTVFLGSSIFVLSILFMLHWLPGYNNPIVIENVSISHNAPSFTKHLNLDKAILGLILLWLVVPKSNQPTKKALFKTVLFFTLATFTSFCLGSITGLVHFELKTPAVIGGWAMTNLFLTCFVEEAFFRGFIQQQLQRIHNSRRWKISCVFLSAGLFGLAHFPGGLVYCVIASLMGLAYAYSYYKTRNIYLPICLHFLFNLIHITGFTYPYVAH